MKNQTMKNDNCVALGLDVAKAKFDACLLRSDGSKQRQTFTNDQTGFTQLAAWLQKFGAAQVHACVEATGPYSLPLALFLHEQGHKTSLVNPARPKAFAQARGCRSKSDRVDAENLAEFTLAQCPAAWQPAAESVQQLQALVRRREDLVGLLQSETLRLEGSPRRCVSDSIARVRRALEKELAKIEAAIEEHFQNEPELHKQRTLLCTIPGVAATTAAKILSELGDPKRFQRARQAGAYAGLTPRLHQSGQNQSNLGHLCKIGSSFLRKSIYMSALTAIRCNSPFKTFAEKLRKAGKAPKVIICAVMRRMLVIATAMLRTEKPFNPELLSLT